MRCAAYLALAAVLVGVSGCGGDDKTPDEVIRAFRAQGIELVVGRETEHDAVVQAVLDPVDRRLSEGLAVNVFRSADDAERFTEQLDSSRRTWPQFVRRGNVIAFFERDAELARQVDAAMDVL